LAIVMFWVISQQHVVSHVSIQVILVIAYFPVISRIWKSNENTESFAAWIGLLLLSSKGVLATIYSLRAIISTSVLLALMVRAELKQRNDRKSEPTI
jgi:hypothetical protein